MTSSPPPRDEGPHRPDYSPKTPPPPKKPVEVPRPQPAGENTHDPVSISGRRSRNRAYEPTLPVAARAGREAAADVRGWDYRPKDGHVETVVEMLFRSAAQDGGRRISVHLADDQDRGQVMILAISHRPDMPAGDDDQVLREAEHLRAAAAPSVRDLGVGTTPDSRRWWAALDLPTHARPHELTGRPARAIAQGPRKMGHPPALAG